MLKIRFRNTFVYFQIFSYFIFITKSKFTKSAKIDLVKRLEIYDVVNMEKMEYDMKEAILSVDYGLDPIAIRMLIGEK